MKKVFIGIMVLALACAAGAMASRPTAEEVKALTQKVADWQIETFEDMGTYRALPEHITWQTRERYHDREWHCGALYAGMYEWSTISGDPKYAGWLKMIGERNGWQLHYRRYHADDHAVGQFYLNLYEDFGDESMIGPTRERFDWILSNAKSEPLDAKLKKGGQDRWSWCDALFMAPPVWARLAKITGESKYLEFMDQEYHATYDLLWDKEEK
ncbi:MAG: glycoside hydrolase family 88 protein, partial [Kiritimatiellaceae bacterium]|nr:glycoside hydrolase family 88 protein [Kiritimatiellaceae bacterium]